MLQYIVKKLYYLVFSSFYTLSLLTAVASNNRRGILPSPQFYGMSGDIVLFATRARHCVPKCSVSQVEKIMNRNFEMIKTFSEQN